MDKAQFEQIKQRGAMLAIASCLYKRGLVTNAEYRKLTAEIQKNTARQTIPKKKPALCQERIIQEAFWGRRILEKSNTKTK